jgi:hypothetical protein
MTPIEQARAVVADLTAKLAATADRGTALAAERDEIAFAAHVDSDAKARKRLDVINAEIAGLGSEAAGINAALVVAGRKVTEAAGAADAEAERQKARKALKLGEQMKDSARACGKSAEAFFAHFAALRGTMHELQMFGATPSINLFDSACRRALASSSVGSRLQLEPLLGPSDRRSFEELADRWAENIDTYAAARLEAPAATEERAA